MPALLLCLGAAGCRKSGMPDYADGYREFAYVANAGSNTVSVLDLVYLRADRTLQVGVTPVALAANPARNEIYALNAQPNEGGGSLSVIDAATNTVAATIPLRHNPTHLSVGPAGRFAYVAETGANSVAVVDLAARRVVAQAPTAPRPAAAEIAPDGRTLVVPSPDGRVELFAVAETRTGPPSLTLRTTFKGCPGASSPRILPDSSKVFLACSGSNRVMVLALAAAPDSWPARQDANALNDQALAMLEVGQTPTHLTMKPDGGEIFVSNRDSDTISEIATQTNEVGSTYGIGNRPAHGVVSADNGALWVANAGADSLSLYSIDDGKLVSSLRTGTAPDALAFSVDPQQTFLLAADARSGDVAVIRTTSKLGPALLTILPAGSNPSAIAVLAPKAK